MDDFASKPVLVTGGTGFLARHTILQLLAAGRDVRATVRSAASGERLAANLTAAGANTRGLDLAIADLLDPPSWPRALAGMGSVLHMATPMQGDTVTSAALDGTRIVLEAAAGAGISRVVVTSTGLAALSGRAGVLTESDWTDVDRRGLSEYARAKTLAERLAWQRAEALGLQLTTILPGAIIGPRIGTDRPGWLDLIHAMLTGKLKLLPPIRLQMIDVRDLAALHVAALLAPAAVGQRYIAMHESYSFGEVAQVLKDDFGPAGAAVSIREMPAWLLRLAGLVDAEARRAVPLLDAGAILSADKARSAFGWQPRAIRNSILETARSLG